MASTNPARSDALRREDVIGIVKSICESRGFEAAEGAETFRKKINESDKSVEAHAVLAMNDALERLDIKYFAIYLSHSDVLPSILETVRVPEALQQKTVPAIRSFSKFDVEGFVTELQEVGVSERASTILADLFLKTDEILNQEADVNQTIVSNLLNIVKAETLMQLGQILQLTGRTPVLIDPALPCEAPYDNGIIIEVRTSGLETFGSGGIVGEYFVFTFDVESIVELMGS